MPEQLIATAVTFADTTVTKATFGGGFTLTGQTAVGFDPDLSTADLIINGQKATADITDALSSCTLTRSITEASTLTLVLEDPDRTLIRSSFAQISAPSVPITVVSATPTTTTSAKPGVNLKNLLPVAAMKAAQDPADAIITQSLSTSSALKLSHAAYYPTTVALTDGTTTLTFCLVEIEKQGNTVTLTFEDILINQLRYCYSPTGYTAAVATMTRADIMAKVISLAMKSLTGNLVQPKVIYPKAPLVGPVLTATDLTWGSSENPDEDAWSFLTQAGNDAQWRCFSTGTALVFGPDGWLLSNPVAADFEEFTDGVGSIDFDFDIGKAEATATVNMATGDYFTFAPGSVCGLSELGCCDGYWIAAEMTRELHQPDCTLELSQAQPALTEQQIAATDGTVSTVTGTDASGHSLVSPTNLTGTSGETTIAQAAVAFAISQIGKPYITGGVGPGGYDCSGLCYAAYLKAGLTIPRTSEEQYAGLPAVSLKDLLPGDLIFYDDDYYANPGHVILFVGGGRAVQAPYTGANVGYTNVWSPAVGAARPSGAT